MSKRVERFDYTRPGLRYFDSGPMQHDGSRIIFANDDQAGDRGETWEHHNRLDHKGWYHWDSHSQTRYCLDRGYREITAVEAAELAGDRFIHPDLRVPEGL